jgi:hypothetical protein
MRLFRAFAAVALATAGSMIAVGATGGPAAAHEHPTPVELDSPAVVQVQTYAHVSISLIEHNKSGPHIGLHQRVYEPLLSSGSGFAVDPTGGIVTSPNVIDVDLRRAEIYAVNQIFHEVYGTPLPADPFAQQVVQDANPAVQSAGRLQRCYAPNATDDTGGCVVFSERIVKVLPLVSSQKQFGNLEAQVLAPQAGQTGDVVVLKVGASSMPTVDLATNAQGVAAFSVLGFTGPPTDGRSLQKLDGHFVSAGATEVKRDAEFEKASPAVGAGVGGGPVVGERGQVVGFLRQQPASGGNASPNLVLTSSDKIREALKKAGIEPHRGPTDGVYENAMHNYKNGLYTLAIPSLEQTLKLYPGHALAADALADSNRKKGTADDLTGRPGQDQALRAATDSGWRDTLLIVVSGATILGLLFGLGVLLRRRTRRRPPAPDQYTADPVMLGLVPQPRYPDEPAYDPLAESDTVLRPQPFYYPSADEMGRDGATVITHAPPQIETARIDTAAPTEPAVRYEAPTEVRAMPTVARPADDPLACSRCGMPVKPTQGFCGHCGQRLH